MTRILVIGIHDSARRQMPVASMRRFCGRCAQVQRAAIQPGTLNPRVVRVRRFCEAELSGCNAA